jgi:cytochrome aa3-600 menaquinol oxidase subunit 1
MGHRSLEKDYGHYISVKKIEETESKLRGMLAYTEYQIY